MYIFVLKPGRNFSSLLPRTMDLWQLGASMQQKSICHQEILKSPQERCGDTQPLLEFAKQTGLIIFLNVADTKIQLKKRSPAVINVSILCLQSLVTHELLLCCWNVSLWSVGSRHSTMLLVGASLLPLFSSPPLLLSFFLPQDDINEAADETERESHPGQHVGVAILITGSIIWMHHGVDDRSAHHKHTRQNLENGSEEEASALDQSEQLIQKCDKGEEAEEYRQDHQGLDCLDPVVIAGWYAAVASICCRAVVP